MKLLKLIIRMGTLFFRKLKYKKLKVRFLENSFFDKNTILEGYNSIGKNNEIYNSYIGLGTYTGTDVKFKSVKVGRFCSIGSNVKNICGRHPTDTFVSTHPAFFSKGKAAGFTFCTDNLFQESIFISENQLVNIGNDVWIGDNVTILDNIKIGNGAIIGTNSLILKDVLPYSINVGTPSKVIRYRFNNDEIEVLENLRWWDKDISWLKENASLLTNIQNFIAQTKS